MSNKYFDSLNRIDLYFTFLPYDLYDDSSEDVTISWFSSNYEIPISIVRGDFVSILLAYKKYNEYLVIYPRDTEIEYEELTEVTDSILSGDWDNIPLVSAISINRDDHSLTLTDEEQKAINEEFSFNNKVVDFDIIKDFRYYKSPSELYKTIELLNMAIDTKHQIYFKYSKNNKVNFYQISPIKIIYDNEENLYHILGIKNKNYVVYDIRFIKLSSVKDIPEGLSLLDASVSSKHQATVHILNLESESYDANNLNEKAPHVWKLAFSQKKATHVKVRFSEDVYTRVLEDLSLRLPAISITDCKDGYFYFEDDIYGVDSFDNWLRTFGSKALILEPKILAEQRIASFKQILENYS